MNNDIIRINKSVFINRFWLVAVEKTDENKARIYCGRPGGSAGLYEAISDLSFEETIKALIV